MKIYIGSDHKGFALKEKLKEYLNSKYEVEDLGAHEFNAHDDYTDFSEKVGREVSLEKLNRGILICGSGAGINISANKINNIRCFIGFDIDQTRSARNDDDVNIIALASDYINIEEAKKLVDVFINTKFESTNNHVRRINKIKELEA